MIGRQQRAGVEQPDGLAARIKEAGRVEQWTELRLDPSAQWVERARAHGEGSFDLAKIDPQRGAVVLGQEPNMSALPRQLRL